MNKRIYLNPEKVIYSSPFIFILSLIFSLDCKAQQPDSIKQPNEKLYIGIGVIMSSHTLYFKNPATTNEANSGRFTPKGVYIGYKFKRRYSLQAGLVGGGSTEQFSRQSFDPDFKPIRYDYNFRTKVIAVPVTIRFVVFNAYKKLPVHITGNVMPAYGIYKESHLKTYLGSKTTDQTITDTGINVYLTAGLGTQFKIRKRFSGVAELLLVRSNLSGNNSKFYDWNAGPAPIFKIINSLSLGISYNFKHKAND